MPEWGGAERRIETMYPFIPTWSLGAFLRDRYFTNKRELGKTCRFGFKRERDRGEKEACC